MTPSLGKDSRPSTLIIDDDVDLLDTWTRLAKTKDLEVTTASGWDEGLALFHILSPDLVIADYNLPGSAHGLQLLSEIRRLRPSVRLVLISGAVETSRLDELEALNIVDRVLSKGDSATATSVILEEIASAAAQSRLPTDWRTFAEASLAAASSDNNALDQIDLLLTASIETESDG